jgi:nucleotide-binding universal stress UspA family protein
MGAARFTLGRVTDRLVREGRPPVLVVRRSSPAAPTLHRALVTLDGSDLAEEALPMVETLAGKPLESVVLLRIVANPQDQGPAMTYLEGVASRLSRLALKVEVVVGVGASTLGIERAARAVDLVILCTHGRGGVDRLRHGSVAEHVVREVDTPALLVRAGTGGEARH